MTSDLLVRERHALPRLQRGERRVQAGRADHGIEHDVHVVARRGLDEQRPAPCHQAGGPSVPVLTRARRNSASEAARLRVEQPGIRERGQRRDMEALALPRDHAERGRADRAGGAQHRDATRRHWKTGMGSHPSNRYETGSTKMSLSKRSSMPP